MGFNVVTRYALRVPSQSHGCTPHQPSAERMLIHQRQNQLQDRYQNNRCSTKINLKVDDEEDVVELEESQSSSKNDSSSTKPTGNIVAKVLEQIFDPIISSPLFATFLFWLPFVANDKLRFRASNFLSKYLDLTIAIPVTGVCLIFAVPYLSYQNRLLDIDIAQGITEQALKQLREARSAQISSSGDDYEFKMALENYEYVLKQEISLRSIAPGIQVPNAPNDPSVREGDVSAVKTFLNMEFSNDGNLQNLE